MSPRQAIRTAASLLFLFAFASAGGASVERRGSFALGNDACDDSEPEIAAQPDGTFLAVWQRCVPSTIAAQRFDALGRRLGAEIDLGAGSFPQVATLPGRGFAVAYLRQLNLDFEIYGVFARRLDPNGAPLADPKRVDEEGDLESRVALAVPRLAAAPDGRLFVAWRDLFISPFPLPIVQLPAFGRMLGPDLSPLGPTADLGGASLLDDLEVSFDETGRALAVSADFGNVFSRRFDETGSPLDGRVDASSGIKASNPRLAPRPGGGWWLAWEEGNFPQVSSRSFLRALGPDGHPAGPRIDLGLIGPREFTWPTVGIDPDGLVLVAARDRQGAIQGRLFDPIGAPLTDPAPLAGPDPFALGRAALAESAPTGFIALWEGDVDRIVPPEGVPVGWDLRGALLAASCPNPSAVCAGVGDARTEVEVRWRLGARSGIGRGLRLGRHLLFALENPGRFDVAVDLRGGAIDWAATTNAEVEIRWTEGGSTRTVIKPKGRFASGRLANPAPPASGITRATAVVASEPADALSIDGCSPSAATACLFGGRFRVEAVATGADGVERPAEALAFADRQAVLSFAESGAATISLLDGRASNGKIWVYWGGLSNAAFRIAITDSMTGTTRTYANPAGKRQSRSDRQAF